MPIEKCQLFPPGPKHATLTRNGQQQQAENDEYLDSRGVYNEALGMSGSYCSTVMLICETVKPRKGGRTTELQPGTFNPHRSYARSGNVISACCPKAT